MNPQNRTPSKVSQMFSGTQDKCAVCGKTAYPLEKITADGEIYHKTCFKCSHGGCTLTASSYAALDGILYCKHHFAQLFMEKGSYNHLNKTTPIKKKEEEMAADSRIETSEGVGEEAEKKQEGEEDTKEVS
ncbi:hypothetical protein HPP92_025483 [Vanilla planifolia]|uniref:LIM zinc-binding domain-containing protein n=1 Tax=Vanilla planifolia TaxID=51239 RepID=A0A835PJA6_VANPL|nr:hypothetical protein HPP92_025483 [Vanilla planifolia]